MAELIGKRYAQALFEVGVELEKLEDFRDEIVFIAQAFKEEPKLYTIIQHPKVSKTEKRDIIDSIFKDRVSEEISNLLYILIDKDREKSLQDISDEYVNLYNEKFNIVDAQAYTAVEMNEDAKLKLQEKLSKKLDKKVNLVNIVDKDIIGGVLVKIKDKVIDESIRKQLEMLGKNLQSVRVTKKEVKNS
ncbi:F0F1 ATP synthase subunit delta [Clostridium sp. D2Q-11]|uniref:ATP synthase subunit delta n=1 Tax=Anaeromonas frigoriresistens TaxID=2683708 RepID=A0A942UWY7_9FIRM|nr:F0F1 ATP synthase subunit delta [Anaeromonas frigoriresistens]MBS4538324.1 F0F1 ATP synthase subunit delta [Anaeromonas frigoriresistens]